VKRGRNQPLGASKTEATGPRDRGDMNRQVGEGKHCTQRLVELRDTGAKVPLPNHRDGNA